MWFIANEIACPVGVQIGAVPKSAAMGDAGGEETGLEIELIHRLTHATEQIGVARRQAVERVLEFELSKDARKTCANKGRRAQRVLRGSPANAAMEEADVYAGGESEVRLLEVEDGALQFVAERFQEVTAILQEPHEAIEVAAGAAVQQG